MNIIGKKYLFFAISLVVIIPGLVSLFLFGLKPSIDFAGGSLFTFSSTNNNDAQTIKEVFRNDKVEIVSIQTSGNGVLVRSQFINTNTHKKVIDDLGKQLPSVKEEDFEDIGPTIGAETTTNAFKALIIASLLIVLYIAWSFRSVPKPASSIRFGICAILALIHDVLVVVGVFSLLGHFYKVEVDSLFVTALLTVIGFSVHDTIVVFDRIRENLRKSGASQFAQVVNDSIIQTLGRSLNTSLTVLLVLFALLLFGGESIRWFVVALLVGITSGTYSSIFNASPLLVVWHELSSQKLQKA